YDGKVPVEMLGGSAFPPIGELTYLLTLPPYGFYWFLLADASQMPSWHQPALERMPELMTLVIKRELRELVEGPLRDTLENEILPTYLAKRRWFAGGAQGRARLVYLLPLVPNSLALCEVEVDGADGPVHYQLPLAFIADGQPVSSLSQALALGRLRRRQQVGLLTDAVSLPEFTRAVLGALREQREMDWRQCRLQFHGTAKLAELEVLDDEPIEPMSGEQSNSSIRVGERMVLKVIRRIRAGVHPEAEMGGYLTEQGFSYIAPLLGEVRRIDAEGNAHTLMLLQGYLESQGDAWNWTQNNLERAIRDEMTGGLSSQENQFGAVEELSTFAHMLGRRLGEMHRVLARPSDDPAFGATPAGPDTCAAWADDIAAQLRESLKILDEQRPSLPAEAHAQAAWLSAQGEALEALVRRLARQVAGGLVMRVHGDLHLGQVLVVGGDAYLIDFEGEPERSLETRRAKHSPYKDVTGVLRSFDYAAALALRNAQGSDSSEEASRARRAIADAYLRQSRTAFMSAYRAATAELPHAWDEVGEAAALSLFGIEKAAYELRYEARYRPDWLLVPLHGLVDLCGPLLENPNR
ncbi:MAG TPA: putative maltokinase, partial [Pseudomonas sp.]|nr:putative maltokinase [Pseudomonas sp.]